MVSTCCKTEDSSQQHLTASTDTVGGGSLVRPKKGGAWPNILRNISNYKNRVQHPTAFANTVGGG